MKCLTFRYIRWAGRSLKALKKKGLNRDPSGGGRVKAWDVKYRPQRQLGGLRWEFFAQEEITIQSQETVVLPL